MRHNNRYRNRADLSIAHGSLTNSKRPSSFVDGVYPTHMQRGLGCYLWDEDGKKYIDYICGLGTNLFGYGNASITAACSRALSYGAVLSFSSTEEVELAELIQSHFPYMERVRFLKSGSEGCSAAVRIARAFTGRNMILTDGYHGWHDDFISDKPPAIGIPKRTWVNPKRYYLERDNIAAIIFEPIITDLSEERINWIKEQMDVAKKHGYLVIFDETITGYRFPRGSFASYSGLNPDIAIMGKAVAGGLPLSIVGGREDVMNCDYFVSSTWAGDRVAISGALAAHKLLMSDHTPKDLWNKGRIFLDEFNSINPSVISIQGYPTRGVLVGGSEESKNLFMQEMCRAGVLFGASWFYNKYLHEEMDTVINIAKSVIGRIERNEIRLLGKPMASPFSNTIRKH